MTDTNENGPRLASRPVGAVSEETSLLHAEKYNLPQRDQQGGAAVSDNITLPREVAKLALAHIEWYIENERGGRFAEVREAAEALRTALAAPCLEVTVDPRLTPDEAAAISSALAAPKPEPVAYFDLQKQVFFWAKPTMLDVPRTVALKPLPLYTAPPAAAPEPESKTPAWWMDGLTATLMREGVNKHRAREIAKGYWEAYCQIEEDKT